MSFTKHKIAFSDTGFFSKTVIDYLNNAPELKSFYDFETDIESFSKVIEQRKKIKTDRQKLTEALKSQYKNIEGNHHSLIQLLLNENTFTVTTGHQLNIFTGPLYFIYKIISCIKLSQMLKEKYSTYNFIPVYWMASEDHDFAEINHVHVFDKKIEWITDAKGACGRINPSSLISCIDELKNTLGETSYVLSLIEIFKEAYNGFNTLADATRYLVNAIFGNYGLLVIDADNATFKKQLSEVIKNDLLFQSSYNCVEETTQLLEKNYKAQITPRPINLFYLKENIRERIVKNDKSFEVLNTSIRFTEEEILSELEKYPEHFSPNVVLRPLYQEMILPNLAYIGGGAEVAYWFQLKALFSHYEMKMPVLILRDSVMIMEKKQKEKLDALKISLPALFKSYDEIVRTVIIDGNEAVSFLNEMNQTASIFENLSQALSDIDITLIQSLNAEKQKAINSIKFLEEKAHKALRRKNETTLNQIKNIKTKLFPDGELQERFYNFSMFYSKFGKELTDTLIKEQNPFEKEFKILIED